MATVVDERNDFKVWTMIPMPRHETANGATSSAATYGSGGGTAGRGVVDTLGYDYIEFLFIKNTGTAAKCTLRFAEQSGAATLFASATALTGGTLSAVTASAVVYRFPVINRASRKRYMNCKLTTSTTCGYSCVLAILRKGRIQPGGTTVGTIGVTTTQEVG